MQKLLHSKLSWCLCRRRRDQQVEVCFSWLSRRPLSELTYLIRDEGPNLREPLLLELVLRHHAGLDHFEPKVRHHKSVQALSPGRLALYKLLQRLLLGEQESVLREHNARLAIFIPKLSSFACGFVELSESAGHPAGILQDLQEMAFLTRKLRRAQLRYLFALCRSPTTAGVALALPLGSS